MRWRLVSEESARRDYGVVLREAAATEALRAQLHAERGQPARFDFGELPDSLAAPV